MPVRPRPALLAFAIAAACGVAAPATTPTVAPTAAPTPTPTPAPRIAELSIRATDFALDTKDRVEAGLLLVTFDNQGKALHNVVFARLKDGKTFEEFKAAAPKGPPAFLPLVELHGGAISPDPGRGRQIVVDLAPGQYALFSSFPGEDGVSDLARGMFRPLEVAARATPTAPDPKADVAVALKEGAPVDVGQVRAGRQTWKFTNDGASPHNLNVAKLLPGKTSADLLAWLPTLKGAAPAEFLGGTQALSPGKSAWSILELTPGDYVAVDDLRLPNRVQATTFTVK